MRKRRYQKTLSALPTELSFYRQPDPGINNSGGNDLLFSDKAFGGNKGNGKFVPGYQLLSRCDSSKKSL
ncbi:hypothetical protein [Lentimicrobium saccharophilum]|uniref:hypothetical protein n=1 Tax=Lentimicrobium saccharophilum TaxID=1678841 RepID=UPI0010C7E223|nr:hypothetical protein [Lentimicrobium saccharophilum]